MAAILGFAEDASARPAPPVQHVIDQAYRAVGGPAWRRVAALETRGAIDLGGLRGAFRQVLDPKHGRDVTRLAAGPLHLEQASLRTLSWQRDVGGMVIFADTPDARADAINQSFIDRMGWFHTSRRRLRAIGEGTDEGRRFDRIEATPRGGRPMTFWFGRDDHLLFRIDQRDASHQLSRTTFSDYRRLCGLRLAYSVRRSNVTAAQDTVQIVDRARILSRLPNVFRPRRSRVIDARLDSARAATIPFNLADGRIEIPVSIDGHAAMPFLLDTGASNLLTPAAVKALGLRGEGAVPLGGTGPGQDAGGTTRVRHVRLGPVRLDDQPFLVLSLPKYLEDRGRRPPIAGLVGAELLRRFPTRIDYAARTLTFYPSARRPPSHAQALPLMFNQGHPFVTVNVDGHAGVFGIDTGDNSGLTLFHPFFRKHKIRLAQPGTPKSQGGAGGASAALLIRVASVQLGSVVLRRPRVNLSLADRGGFSGDEIGGNLGYGFLKNFTFVLDYAHRVGFFQRAASLGNRR